MEQSSAFSSKNKNLPDAEKLITGNDPVAINFLRQVYSLLKDNSKKLGAPENDLLKEIERAYKNKKSADHILLEGLKEFFQQAYELLYPDGRAWNSSKEELYIIFEKIVFLKAREDVFKDFFDNLEDTITAGMMLDFSKRVMPSKIISEEGNVFDYAATLVNMFIEKMQESVLSVHAVNTILETLPDTITIITDKTGEIRFINKFGEQFLGVLRYDLFGQSIQSIFENYDTIAAVFKTEGGVKNMDVAVSVGDRKCPAVLTAKKTNSQVNEVEEIVYMINLQPVELTANADDLRREMHDKIAPLNNILGVMELIEDRLIDADSRVLTTIVKNAALKLKRDAAHHLQLLSGQIQEEKKEFIDVSGLIKEIIEELNYNEGFKEVSITYEINADFYAKKSLLHSIILNLLTNALKYRKKGVANLIHIRFIKNQPDQFLLEISDTGVGIEKEHLPGIFMNSFRVSEGIEGYGSGLSIVKDNVRKLNGEIRVSSTVGKGTIFSLTFHQVKK